MEHTKYISIREAAKRLNMSTQKIRSLVKANKLKTVVAFEPVKKILAESFEEYLKQN